MKIVICILFTILCFTISCSNGAKNINDSEIPDYDDEQPDVTDEDAVSAEDDGFSDFDNDQQDQDNIDVENESDLFDKDELTEPDEETIPDEDNTVWPPLGCIQGEYKAYFGDFHSHTGNSDGEGTPESAFEYARDTAGLDILAVTDHLEQLYTLYGMADDDFPDCIKTAESFSDQNFLALCGYEYGSGFEVSIETGLDISTGHSNVFFHEKLLPMIQLDFMDYYGSLENCSDCIAQFNHPGDEENQTFHEFEPYQAIFDKMALYEFNGAGDVWNLYFVALSKGWYLSPTFNQDNHSANWGTADDNRTGVYMSEFSMAGLKEAFIQRRTFATEDKNATIKMLAGNTCWMGSQITGVKNIKITVDVTDIDNEGFEKIELFDGLQNVISQINCEDTPECQLEFDLSVQFPMYILARATQTDGQKIVSAPLWFIP